MVVIAEIVAVRIARRMGGFMIGFRDAETDACGAAFMPMPRPEGADLIRSGQVVALALERRRVVGVAAACPPADGGRICILTPYPAALAA